MIELALAVAIPAAVLWLVAWRTGGDFHRAVTRWFVPLVVLWFAPCWATGRSPAPFDYVAADVWPWMKPGFTSANPLLSDATLQFFPWREAVKRSVIAGSLPFLDRSAGCGTPLWENPQSGAAWPLTWLGLPFSTFAWPLFAAVTKMLAALAGMYLFLRRRDAPHVAAIAGAIAYGCCAFNIAFLLFPHTNVTALLPLLLLAIDAATPAGIAAVVALMMLGGHPESVLYCAVVAVPYAIIVMLRTRRFVPTLGACAAGILIAAPAVLPFALYLPHSERLARVMREPGIVATPPPTAANLAAFFSAAHLESTRNPNIVTNFNEVASQYAGLVTFGLALAAALFDTRRQRFWIAIFAVAAFFSFDSAVARAITSAIPLVNVAVLGRLRFVAAFAVAVLASGGARLLADRASRNRTAIVVGVVAAAAIPLAGVVAVVCAAAVALTRRAVLVPIAIAADLASILLFYNPPVARQFAYPRATAIAFLAARPGGRIAAIGAALRPETATMAGLEDIGFHNPMAYEPYGALLARGGYDRRTYFNGFHLIPPKAMLDFLGVRYVVAPPWFRSAALPIAYQGRDATIFENRSAMPRAVPFSGAATVTLESYRPSRETIVVRASTPARIATSEIALPGWRLTRGGEQWPTVRLRGVFIGFEAPAGESRFVLRYEPVGFRPGMLLAAAGLLLLFTIVRVGGPVRAQAGGRTAAAPAPAPSE